MTKLREKSEFNIAAAQLLIDSNYYAPSVHCSYYSCFQLLKFVINDFFDIDYATLSINIASSKQKTHQYVINYVSNEIEKLDSKRAGRNIKRRLKDLKQYRAESDYEDIEVNIDKGRAAYKKATEIRSYLKKNFNV